MPRVCTVCSHPEREAIDAALIQSTPNRRIAARYTLNEGSVRRHAAAHLPATLTKAAAVAEVTHADDLIAKVRQLEADARRIATAAESSKDLRTALAGVRELTRIVELLAKLRGDIGDGPTVNIMNVDASGASGLAGIRESLAAKLAAPAIVQGVPALTEPSPTVIDVEPE